MSTSVTKNRLLHISDLPNIQKYNPTDINKLLPIHYSTLRDNVLTMIYYEINNFDKKILIHDPNLTINSTNYSQVRGGWCEDFDQQQQSSSASRIKKSIQIGVLILNYLQALCQSKIKHNHRNQQENLQNIKIIAKSQCLTHTQINSHLQTYPDKIKDTLKRSSKNLKAQFQSFSLQKQPQPFIEQEHLTIAYNIYKKNKKYIFLTGVDECYTQNFFNSINLFRHWNLTRLKINVKLNMNFDKLCRVNAYMEHLFSISRGFIFSTFQQKQINDPFPPMSDLNDNKKHLKHLLSYFDIDKDIQNSSELIFQNIKQKEVDTFTVLQDTLRVYRFCLTYKLENESNEQRSSLMVRLNLQFARILGKILAEVPINVNISYCFQCKHNQTTNQLIIMMIFNYKSNHSKHIFLTAEDVGISIRNLSKYLNKINYEDVQTVQRNIADEVFKSSYVIFNKYNQIVQNSGSSSSQKDMNEKFGNIKLSVSIMKSQSSLQLSKQKEVSTPMRPIYGQSTSSRHKIKQKTLSQSSTIFSKSLGYSQIQVEYKKLINSLEQRQANKCILNPIELKKCLKQYLQPYYQINHSLGLLKDQKLAILFVGASCQLLTPQDIYQLILKFQDNADAICQYFMQEGNLTKIIEVAKLFTSKLPSLFKEYLSLGNGFKNFRYHILINYLKKMLQKYHLKNNSTPQFPQINLTELRIEDLIFLLQRKTYNCLQYKNLVVKFLPQIFLSRPQSKFLCTILYHFYIYLLNNDHHQDLVSSFIADIFYEVVHFTNQLTSIMLNNSRYRKNIADLKEKKFCQIIRDGGFLAFGYQVRNVLIPQLLNVQPIVLYDQLIVSTIKIEKPSYFKTIIKMIENTFFSQNFTTLTQQIIKKNKIYFQSLDRNVCMSVYRIQILNLVNQLIENKDKQQNKQELQDPLMNIDISQSGIFRDLISLNPNLKIAGKSLKEQYARKLKQKQYEENKFTVHHFLSKIVNLNIEQAWQYIQLAIQLKNKVLQAQKVLKQKSFMNIQDQAAKDLIYIKQTLQHIYSKLSKIYEYLALSDVICRFCNLQASVESINE